MERNVADGRRIHLCVAARLYLAIAGSVNLSTMRLASNVIVNPNPHRRPQTRGVISHHVALADMAIGVLLQDDVSVIALLAVLPIVTRVSPRT